MAENQQASVAAGAAPAPPATLSSQAKEAGFSDDEINNFLAAKKPQDQTPAPPAPAATAANAPAPSEIPAPPPPIPGSYSPEQEQNALRDASTIADPEERLGVISNLKRNYANERIMDGITRQAREDAKNTSYGAYIKAAHDLFSRPDINWSVKQATMKKLIDVMWEDPTLGIGDARELVQHHMENVAGMPDTKELGSAFTEAQNAIIDGRIVSQDQLLQMERAGTLTHKGVTASMETLNIKNRPDLQVQAEQRVLAFNHIKDTVLKDVETDFATGQQRPNGKQLAMVNRIQSSILNQVAAAKGDLKEIARITSTENVDKVIEATYPHYEQHLDRVSFGVPVNVNGIIVPGFVDRDPKTVTAYRDIVAAPPFAAQKDGKMQTVPQPNWQTAVNALLANPSSAATKAHFKQAFPKEDPDYIISVVKTTPLPPSAAPVPTVARQREQAMPISGMTPQDFIKSWAQQMRIAGGDISGIRGLPPLPSIRLDQPAPAPVSTADRNTIRGALEEFANQWAKASGVLGNLPEIRFVWDEKEGSQEAKK